ncbi:MAG: hypothetical protein AUH78_25315 [Gemmatimonadetes bacterium 13_1_40CM_4_69_8]|nr:MAG: hypothetical protein AUH78_25315 [Gemmatimonadetes bacterium 13_1_40CM_4_69_8]
MEVALSDAGPLGPSGGEEEASLLDGEVPGLLTVQVLHASTVGRGNHSRSEASVASLSLTAGGHSVSAGFLMARAEAQCTNAGPTASGSSQIAELVIDGQAIVVSGEPNQTITLPAGQGQVVINQQTRSGPGDITVNALHVTVTGIADVIISSAHADITCPGPPTCPGGDFVTGGGWITASGAKANFAVAGGIKQGALWGHLTYLDHGVNLKVKGTGVTTYEPVEPKATTRHIVGTADINGQPGSYEVVVADNGEPGRDDTFTLKLSTGYTASGKLDGGNIQLHNPCP